MRNKNLNDKFFLGFKNFCQPHIIVIDAVREPRMADSTNQNHFRPREIFGIGKTNTKNTFKRIDFIGFFFFLEK